MSMWQQLKKEARKVAKKPITVCSDIDGTLLEYNSRSKSGFGEPRQDVVDVLRKLKKKGIKVVLCTACSERHKEDLIKHLSDYGLEDIYDDILMGDKPQAFAYLDDRSLNVLDGDWKSKLDDMIVKFVENE